MVERRIWLHHLMQWHDNAQEQKWEMALEPNQITTLGHTWCSTRSRCMMEHAFGILFDLHSSLGANLIQAHCLWDTKMHSGFIATTETQITKGRMSYDQLLGQCVLEFQEF